MENENFVLDKILKVTVTDKNGKATHTYNNPAEFGLFVMDSNYCDEYIDELEKKIKEITNKWKNEMLEQNITDFKIFYRLNYATMCEDMEEFWDAYSSIGKVSVVDEDQNIVATTDFTDESKNLEVWKALRFQEEDFYKK